MVAPCAPRQAPLSIATFFLVVALIMMTAAPIMLTRIRQFARRRFDVVFKWALLGYVIESAMNEFAFVRDHVRGSSLVIVTLMLAIFATSVPVTIAFTTARYADLENDKLCDVCELQLILRVRGAATRATSWSARTRFATNQDCASFRVSLCQRIP